MYNHKFRENQVIRLTNPYSLDSNNFQYKEGELFIVSKYIAGTVFGTHAMCVRNLKTGAHDGYYLCGEDRYVHDSRFKAIEDNRY